MTHVTEQEREMEEREMDNMPKPRVARVVVWQTVATRPDFRRDNNGIFRKV